MEKGKTMSEHEKKVILALADNRLNTSDAANALNLHRNTVLYHIGKIRWSTGLDPLDFHDMCKLYAMVRGERKDNV